MSDVHDLGLIIDAHVPLIVIQSQEEPRALDTITRLAIKRQLPLYGWTITDGLRRLGFGLELEQDDKLSDPDKVLEHIKKLRTPSIFTLCDFHPYLADEPRRVRLLKDIALASQQNRHTLILLSHSLTIPPELRHYSARFELKLPSSEQIMALVREEAAAWSRSNQGAKVKTDNRTLQQLVKNLSGLPLSDVRRLVRGAIYDDGAINEDDIPEVNKTKFELMDMEAVLSFEYDTARFSDVGGLANLKAWLAERRTAFFDVPASNQPRLEPPKGVLLLGVQGGGKSLAAKAVAGLWKLPLLRMDMGALYNKFFGETERNMREALRLADLMAPCVLWIDEIEKGLGQDQTDQGVSKRVLGTLLTWMAERKHPVFIVATANNIKQLPPELMRKGRLDEIFFVDLPDAATRAEIFRIHLAKRDLAPADFQLEDLVAASEDFSGAEIEQGVVSALYLAAAQGQALSTGHLSEALSRTQPLAVVMAEEMQALRAWASGRTVLA